MAPDGALQFSKIKGAVIASPVEVYRPSSVAAPANQLSAPWTIFWTALLVRIAYITLAHTYRFPAYEDHFHFGWEVGRIARAVATGRGYADPFNGHTGPTTWVTPLYPLLLAAVFKLCGSYTALSAWMILAINSIFSAFMTRTVWEIAARCFDRRVAVWSAWIWALYPAAMQYAVRWVWEMTLTAFLFSWVIVLALRMRDIGDHETRGMTVSRWAWFGLLWGLIALSSPSLLIFLPFCGLWVLAGARDWKRQIAGVALASCLCIACIAPWIYRNWLAFHQFVPMRGNFGAELYMGNGPGANGLLIGSPTAMPHQFKLYQQMGEQQYAKSRGQLAMAYIRSDPWHFVRLSIRRFYYYWAGVPHAQSEIFGVEFFRSLNFDFTSLAGLLGLALAWRRKVPAVTLFAMAFAVIPLVFYLVFAQARMRHPLEPLICILGVYLFQSADRTRNWSFRAGSAQRKPVAN